MSIIGAEELRHLDGIKGSFTFSESEYLATLILSTKIDMASQIAYSNVNLHWEAHKTQLKLAEILRYVSIIIYTRIFNIWDFMKV
jgi:hypothetical protein